MNAQTAWALVLAGGDGSRLRSLTMTSGGTAVPKQFCSFHSGRLLIEDAIDRARSAVASKRICAVVAHQHRCWWADLIETNSLMQGNVFVQPQNRGTAIGVVYSLLLMLRKDPHALVLLLPADHYISDEQSLSVVLRIALQGVRDKRDRVFLLGFEPDEIDADLGYIVPGNADSNIGRTVTRFVEKPPAPIAAELISEGALWNAFIVAGSARSLLKLFRRRHTGVLQDIEAVLDPGFFLSVRVDWEDLVRLYDRLPTLDFCRDVLEGQESALRVIRVPPCGWSDLGTPRRVGQAVGRLSISASIAELRGETSHINLAARHARLASQQKDLLS